MTLKLKLVFVVVFEVILIVSAAAILGYRESKWELKALARDLLEAKTDQAFVMCQREYEISNKPSESLKNQIARISIPKDGYVAVLKNRNEDGQRGVLVVHPTAVGISIYSEDFPHIQNVLDEIEDNGLANGYQSLIEYTQGTLARGRQGEKKVANFKYFAPWDWVIMSTGYERDIFYRRDVLRQTLAELVVFVLLVGVILIYITIHQMMVPVQRLTASTREVARGNWNVSISYDSDDEIGTLSHSFNQMVRSLRENAHIWQELKIARDMQMQMLPETYPTIKNLQISAKSLPANDVGGDFYDFIDFDQERLGIVVGDVSGHGLSAAMVMMAAVSAVRFATEDRETTSEVLNLVNVRLNKDTQNQMFVALFFCIYDPEKRILSYSNAGQTMPYLCRNGEVSFLPQSQVGDRFPLGIVREASYEQLSIELKPGDMIVFYTDGIVDAMNGDYQNYGFERFAESIIRHSTKPPDQMVARLVQEMQEYRNGSNFHDDVTIVVLRIKS